MGVIILTPEIEEIILARLAEGDALNAICADESIPVAESTVRKRAIEDEDFGARYARARSIGYDCRAERAVENARAADDAQVGRLAFDAERWYLGKMKPKVYGDAMQLRHADADGGKLDLAAVIEARRAKVADEGG